MFNLFYFQCAVLLTGKKFPKLTFDSDDDELLQMTPVGPSKGRTPDEETEDAPLLDLKPVVEQDERVALWRIAYPTAIRCVRVVC